MTIQEHLLTMVSEEAVEVAHRISKQLRFSEQEVQPGQTLTNGQRVMEEFYDLVTVIEKCQRMNILPEFKERDIQFHKDAKNIKIDKFLELSRQNGTLNSEPNLTDYQAAHIETLKAEKTELEKKLKFLQEKENAWDHPGCMDGDL